ncbi:MAG: SHOCT domain-containing protein [Dehalococcoidia bacterium]|nr:SHOCT domain-containing protein [Dehalococcoidia bacterium]
MVPFFDMWEFWPWMIFGPLSMIIFWGVVIWAVVTLVTRSNQPSQGSGTGSAAANAPGHANREPTSALQILEERFARGEISQEEFEEKRRVLRSSD